MGRYRHDAYDKLGFIPIRVSGKTCAVCRKCGLTLKNTAQTRLELHGIGCKGGAAKTSTNWTSPQDGSTQATIQYEQYGADGRGGTSQASLFSRIARDENITRDDFWEHDAEDSILSSQDLLMPVKTEPPDPMPSTSSEPPQSLSFRGYTRTQPSKPTHQQQPQQRSWRQIVPQQAPPGGGGGGGMGLQQQVKQALGSQQLPQHKKPQQPSGARGGMGMGVGQSKRVPSPPPQSASQPPAAEVCLRWNSYHSNMQATFPSLLTNEQFVDVTLACEGRSIKCHKVILSACSAYFEDLLSANPCQHPIVLMKDLRYWEVQALVDFMYRGEVNVAQDKLPSLLAAAEALQIKGLAGPASTSSSHDEDSLPSALASSIEDYLDEQVPSPITERRMRKRRMMSAVQPTPPQQQQHQHQQHHQQQQLHQQQQSHQPLRHQQQHHQQPTSMPSPRQVQIQPSATMIRSRQQQHQQSVRNSAPIPSTSTYRPEPEVPPPRKQRRSEPPPPVPIKIEPIDIDISNDSMDDEEFLEKKFTLSPQDGDDGGGEEPPDEGEIERKPNIDTADFSSTASTAPQESSYPFEPGNTTTAAAAPPASADSKPPTKANGNAENADAASGTPYPDDDDEDDDDDGESSHDEKGSE